MPYVEEAFKLDVRAIMSAALKTGKKSQYSVTISCPTGYLISVDLHENADRVATASITVNWPENAEDQVSGGIFLEYRGYEGRAAEQTLYLTGTRQKSAAGNGRSGVPKRNRSCRRFIWRLTATGFCRARQPA